MTHYSKRESLLEKTERTWTVDGSGLSVSQPDRAEVYAPFADIQGVRLTFAPSRMKPNRYACMVSLRNGLRLETDNMHFKGIGDFEDRADTYRAMVEDLLKGIAADRPGFTVDVGSGAYWPMMLFVIAAYVAAGLAILVTVGVTWPVAAIVDLGAMLIGLPLLIRWMVRARPRRARVDDLPQGTLP